MEGWMEGWMDGVRDMTATMLPCGFTGGHWLQRSETGNKTVAHSRGTGSIPLVTAPHWMTYVRLVFHQLCDSRCLRNKHT